MIKGGISVGNKLFLKLRASKGSYILDRIPPLGEWNKIAKGEDKIKASWRKENIPMRGTFEYNVFRRLEKAFGFYTKGFFYWSRKIR